MPKKTLKFRDFLVPLVLSGEKDVTWRLFDDKDLKVGDEIDFINWNTGETFGEGVITAVREKTLGTLEPSDYQGHEKFESEQSMYEHYQLYYKDKQVGPDTPLKILKFEFKKV